MFALAGPRWDRRIETEPWRPVLPRWGCKVSIHCFWTSATDRGLGLLGAMPNRLARAPRRTSALKALGDMIVPFHLVVIDRSLSGKEYEPAHAPKKGTERKTWAGSERCRSPQRPGDGRKTGREFGIELLGALRLQLRWGDVCGRQHGDAAAP